MVPDKQQESKSHKGLNKFAKDVSHHRHAEISRLKSYNCGKFSL